MTRYTPDAKRVAQLPLQGKVGKIIRSLAKSSFEHATPVPEELTNFAPEVSEEALTRSIEAWRERSSYLPRELLADPVWGMLLELLQAEVQDRRVSVSRLCSVSEVAPSAAVRWLKALEHQELAVRRIAPQDADDDFVELSSKGRSALRCYFHDVVESHQALKAQR